MDNLSYVQEVPCGAFIILNHQLFKSLKLNGTALNTYHHGLHFSLIPLCFNFLFKEILVELLTNDNQ